MAGSPTKKATPAKKAAAKSTVSGAENRRRQGEIEHELVTVKLAHYLPEGNEFHPDGEAVEAGSDLEVKRHQARHLISAGYAAVDAEDPAAVAQALQLGPAGGEVDDSDPDTGAGDGGDGDGDGDTEPKE